MEKAIEWALECMRHYAECNISDEDRAAVAEAKKALSAIPSAIETLTWYADETVYKDKVVDQVFKWPIMQDSGKRARDAIKKLNGGNGMKEVIAVGDKRYAVVAEREDHYECRPLNKAGQINSSRRTYDNVPKAEAVVLGYMFPVNHPVFAFSQGDWHAAMYDSIGNVPGEHWVMIDGKRTRIIKNELRYIPEGH